MWNLPTVLIGSLVALLLILAVCRLVRRGGDCGCGEHSENSGCGNGCSGCSGCPGCTPTKNTR